MVNQNPFATLTFDQMIMKEMVHANFPFLYIQKTSKNLRKPLEQWDEIG